MVSLALSPGLRYLACGTVEVTHVVDSIFFVDLSYLGAGILPCFVCLGKEMEKSY